MKSLVSLICKLFVLRAIYLGGPLFWPERLTMKLYKVGGCVRDEIMGVPAKDIDFACEAESFEAMEKFIVENGGKVYQSKPEFFTVRARLFGVDSDYVLCRKEGKYSDGRRPDNVMAGTIYDDLARRDFKMNAIAKDMDGNIIDPFGGIADINTKKISCVGDTVSKFCEDSLRLIRAIRFSITKGFTLDSNIVSALNDYIVVTGIINVSKERIREELLKCFAHDTYLTLFTLYKFPLLIDRLFNNNELWLKPTLEVK